MGRKAGAGGAAPTTVASIPKSDATLCYLMAALSMEPSGSFRAVDSFSRKLADVVEVQNDEMYK